MARRYAKAQMDYMKAKAAYDLATDAFEAIMAPYDRHLDEWADDEARVQEYTDIHAAASETTGMAETREALQVAQKALFVWARTGVAKLPQYKEHPEVEHLFEQLLNGKVYKYSIVQSMIDLTLKLAA